MENNKIKRWCHKLLSKVESFSKFALNKISKVFDRTVYNEKATLIVTLFIAIVSCVGINFEDISFQLFHNNDTTLNLTGIPVDALYDAESYEVLGLPTAASVTLSGDSADIQMIRQQNSITVRADLRSLEPGDNVVPLEAIGIPSNVHAEVSPNEAKVSLNKKESRTFFVTPELLVGSGQSTSTFQTPVLSTTFVTVTGTAEKLNSIRSVKAIVDASGRKGSFTTNSVVVAYDGNGKQVNVTIGPETVKATVSEKSSS